MDCQLLDKNERLAGMSLKLSGMSINNIKWACMYSGAGIIHMPRGREITKMLSSTGVNFKETEILQNTCILKCIYKKAKPVFAAPPDEISKPGSYMWDFKSFSKIILPSTQSFAILSMLRAAEILYYNDLPAGTAMVKSAEIYYDFLSTYSRNHEGLFISVEDRTKSINEELKLKPCQKDTKLIDQLFVFESALYLYYVTSMEGRREYFNPNNKKYLNEARNIFSYLYENYNSFLELTSKELSLCISSIARCCKIEKDNQHLLNYTQLIALLCAELESRVKVTGEVERCFNDLSTSSLITHFRAASAFMEGYVATGIDKFKDFSLKIFRHLINLFDMPLGLFTQGDNSEISCSIRDAAEIIKGLGLYYNVEKNDKILEILNIFYISALERSGIVQSTPERIIRLSGSSAVLPGNIPNTFECGRAPVFMRSFRIIFKRISTCTVSKHFNSSYALYSSYMFLNYFNYLPDESPNIDKEGCEDVPMQLPVS